MTTDRPGVFARFFGLLRGWAAGWVRTREQRNPQAVYEHAIGERVQQYRSLKEAVAGILYMRNKLEAELVEQQGELSRTRADIQRAVQRRDDEAGLALIAHKQVLLGGIDRAEQEYQALRSEAEEAKANLVRFREEIRALEREKGRTLASLANARVRRRMREALDGISVDADMRALESVREHVAKLVTHRELDTELDQPGDLESRIRAIRDEATSEAARRELEELKREMARYTLPAQAQPVPVSG